MSTCDVAASCLHHGCTKPTLPYSSSASGYRTTGLKRLAQSKMAWEVPRCSVMLRHLTGQADQGDLDEVAVTRRTKVSSASLGSTCHRFAGLCGAHPRLLLTGVHSCGAECKGRGASSSRAATTNGCNSLASWQREAATRRRGDVTRASWSSRPVSPPTAAGTGRCVLPCPLPVRPAYLE